MYDGCTYEEVEAMRELDGDPFTLMTMFKREDLTDEFGSEDAYFEMFLEPYYNWLYTYEPRYYYIDDNLQYLPKTKRHKRKYLADKNYKARILKRMSDYGSDYMYGYPCSFSKQIDDNGKEYIERSYRGSRSSFLKHIGNIRVRRSGLYPYPKGKGYKKTFDFWWELD